MDPITASYRDLLTAPHLMIDVRAPVEFARGAVPGAVNLPILTDPERAAVGTRYRHAGPDAARRLGHELVHGAMRAARTRAWRQAIDGSDAPAVLYCWRGGERSGIAQSWLHAEGVVVPRVAGGIKALRSFALATIEQAPIAANAWWVIGGRTGCAKTVVVRQLERAIDLEGLANHRGSAFGAHGLPQPTPIEFEFALAAARLRLSDGRIVLEDESRTIGRLALPASWHERMQRAPIALVERPLTERIRHIRAEYVDSAIATADAGKVHTRYVDALSRISRRLGGARHRDVLGLLDRAFAQGVEGDHETWIGALLEWYYDPMYDHQLAAKAGRIRFTGSPDAVCEFLAAQ